MTWFGSAVRRARDGQTDSRLSSRALAARTDTSESCHCGVLSCHGVRTTLGASEARQSTADGWWINQLPRPDTWPATESAPRCGGGDLGDTKGLNAARPDDLPAALSHGRLETGPGGGPVSRCLQKPPLGGGTSAPIAQDAVGANRPS